MEDYWEFREPSYLYHDQVHCKYGFNVNNDGAPETSGGTVSTTASVYISLDFTSILLANKLLTRTHEKWRVHIKIPDGIFAGNSVFSKEVERLTAPTRQHLVHIITCSPDVLQLQPECDVTISFYLIFYNIVFINHHLFWFY